jgi:hypothetical protein
MDGLKRGEGGVMLHPRRKKDDEIQGDLDNDLQLEKPVMVKKKKKARAKAQDEFDVEDEGLKVERKTKKEFDIDSSAQMTNDEAGFSRPSRVAAPNTRSKISFEEEESSEALNFRPSRTQQTSQPEKKPEPLQGNYFFLNFAHTSI